MSLEKPQLDSGSLQKQLENIRRSEVHGKLDVGEVPEVRYQAVGPCDRLESSHCLAILRALHQVCSCRLQLQEYSKQVCASIQQQRCKARQDLNCNTRNRWKHVESG